MADYNLGTAHGTVKIDSDTKGVDQANQALGTLDKKGQDAGVSLDSVGNKSALAGATIVGGLAVAVNAAANFEQRLSAIRAVSGATAGEMDLIRDAALRIGKDTAFSATEAASAMEELSKAGISTEDILGGVADATVALAAAGEVDLPQAAMISSNALNQFNLSAKDMGTVVDYIAGAANASAIDVSDFGMAMSQVGAVANLAGLSFQDTAVAIAEMGNAGIKGSDAGTSLKTMLSNLQPTTEAAATAMKDLGIITEDGTNRFYDAQGNLKSLREIQEILQSSTDGLTSAQKQQALQTIFGSDAIRAAAVMANEGAKGFDNLNKTMTETSAAEVAKTRMDNMKGSLEGLKGSAETFAIQIGTLLIPILKSLIDGVTSVVNWFMSLDEETKSLIVGIVAGVGAALLMTTAIIKIYQAVKTLQAGFAALKLAFAANPFGIIIAGLIILGTFLATAWATSETFRNKVKAALETVKNAWNTMWSFIDQHKAIFITIASLITAILLPALVRLGVQATIAAAKMVAGWVASSAAAATSVVSQVAGLGRLIAQFVLASLRSYAVALQWVAIWTVTAAATLAQWALMAAGAVKNAVIIATQWLITNGAAMASSLVSMAVAVATTVAGWIAMAATAVANAVIIAAQWLIAMGPIGWAIALLIAVIAAVIIFWDDIKAWFQKGAEWVSGIMSDVWEWIKGVWGWIVDAFKAAGEAIWNTLKAIGEFIWNAFRSYIQFWMDLATGIWNALKQALNWIVGVWSSILNFLGGIPSAVAGFFGNAISWLANAGKNIISGLINGIVSAVSWIWTQLTNIVNGIFSFFGNAGSWLLNVGKNIVTGLWNGIANAASWLWDKIVGWIDGLIGGVMDFLGIDSPSKVLAEIGRFMMLGLGGGIDDEASTAIRAADAAARDVVAAMEAGLADGAALEATVGAALTDGTAAALAGATPGLGSSAATAVQGSVGIAGSSATASQAAIDKEFSRIVNMEFNTYNPVAERASDNEARRIRAAAAVGSF